MRNWTDLGLFHTGFFSRSKSREEPATIRLRSIRKRFGGSRMMKDDVDGRRRAKARDLAWDMATSREHKTATTNQRTANNPLTAPFFLIFRSRSTVVSIGSSSVPCVIRQTQQTRRPARRTPMPQQKSGGAGSVSGEERQIGCNGDYHRRRKMVRTSTNRR